MKRISIENLKDVEKTHGTSLKAGEHVLVMDGDEPAMVVMGIDAYGRLERNIVEARRINDAWSNFQRTGVSIPASEVFKGLREKYSGN